MHASKRPIVLFACFLLLGLTDLYFLDFWFYPMIWSPSCSDQKGRQNSPLSGLIIPTSTENAATTDRFEPYTRSLETDTTNEQEKSLETIFQEKTQKAAEVPERTHISFIMSMIIPFETSEWEYLSPASCRDLEKVLIAIEKHPQAELLIEGHSDIRGDVNYNYKLSKLRAQRVASFLKSKGINSENMQIEAFGPAQPTDPRDTEEAWALNRRVEVIVKDIVVDIQ